MTDNHQSKVWKGMKPTLQLLGMTQKDVIKRLGIVQSYISQLASGRLAGSMKMWERIADSIDIPFAMIALEALDVEDIKYGTEKTLQKAKDELYHILGISDRFVVVKKKRKNKSSKRKTVKEIWAEVLEDNN